MENSSNLNGHRYLKKSVLKTCCTKQKRRLLQGRRFCSQTRYATTMETETWGWRGQVEVRPTRPCARNAGVDLDIAQSVPKSVVAANPRKHTGFPKSTFCRASVFPRFRRASYKLVWSRLSQPCVTRPVVRKKRLFRSASAARFFDTTGGTP